MGGHLRQPRAASEMLVNVINHSAEPSARERRLPSKRKPAGRKDLSEQMDRHNVGQRLSEKPPAETTREYRVYCVHRSLQGRQVYGVQRRDRQPRGVEVEHLDRDACQQRRLQKDIQLVQVRGPAPPGSDGGPGRARSLQREEARAVSHRRSSSPVSAAAGRKGGACDA
jgi:hypothetical protein